MIYYKMYNPAGLINQLMSIELAVGIKEVSGQDISIYNILNGTDKQSPIFAASRHYNSRGSVVDNSTGFVITDILNWKDKEEYSFIFDQGYSVAPGIDMIENLMEYYHDQKDVEDLDFAEGRKRIDFSKNMNIKNTLGWYSRFFNGRTKQLDDALKSVKFLPEYYELSEKIAKSLGDFNGVHLRLTDHVSQRVNTTQDMFNYGIEKISDGRPIVVCTDQPDSKLLSNGSYVMLDKYILDNFSQEFMEFRYRDEVSFGLLNNLVMHHSKKFVGTIGSTYSGYIHRGMNQKTDIDWMWFDYLDDPVYASIEKGVYSWNGSYKMGTQEKQWFREWKESRLK